MSLLAATNPQKKKIEMSVAKAPIFVFFTMYVLAEDEYTDKALTKTVSFFYLRKLTRKILEIFRLEGLGQ